MKILLYYLFILIIKYSTLRPSITPLPTRWDFFYQPLVTRFPRFFCLRGTCVFPAAIVTVEAPQEASQWQGFPPLPYPTISPSFVF